MTECSFPGCDRPRHAQGYCSRHYMRLRRHGSVETVKPRRERVAPEERNCAQCGATFLFVKAGKAYKGLYCSRTCSNRANKNNRFRHGPDHPNWKGGHVESHGYRQIWVDDDGKRKLVLEHRHVMEQSLGRPLGRDETVHHRNGDRLDNRLENLQLWSSRHPRGQRVDDLLTFAREIIALYG